MQFRSSVLLFEQWPEELARVRRRHLDDVLGTACRDDGAALVATLRAEVDDVVSRLDDVEVVLDDDDGVAACDEALQDV